MFDNDEDASKDYYREAARVLKSDGLLVVSEYHPIRRVWKRSGITLEVGFNYFDRGPHRFEAAPDVLCPTPGELEQFEFHWTVADYISAILASGCRLLHVEEFGDTADEWEGAPMAGLPLALLLVGRRTGPAGSTGAWRLNEEAPKTPEFFNTMGREQSSAVTSIWPGSDGWTPPGARPSVGRTHLSEDQAMQRFQDIKALPPPIVGRINFLRAPA